MAAKFKISDIKASEILDSRGNPTLKVTVYAGKTAGSFSVPSGASTGIHEALEKRDGDKNRFRGLSVRQTVKIVNTEIKKSLQGEDIREQRKIDNILIKLDGTPNKSRLGANAILGVSIASAKAAAKTEELENYEYLKEQITGELEQINERSKHPKRFCKDCIEFLAFIPFYII